MRCVDIMNRASGIRHCRRAPTIEILSDGGDPIDSLTFCAPHAVGYLHWRKRSHPEAPKPTVRRIT